MHTKTDIQAAVASAIRAEFDSDIDEALLVINPTKPEFEGEYTLVTFPLTRIFKQTPEQIATKIGESLIRNSTVVRSFQVVKGFLNLTLSDGYWRKVLGHLESQPDFWRKKSRNRKIVVEFSSPNTNKPLHLGHIRNNLLGWSVSRILEATGNDVVKVQIINDRGIAICKSMLAWQKFGNGQTPESAGMKPDHFVGHWYVRFEQEFQKEYQEWQKSEAAEQILRDAGSGKDKETSFKEYKNTYFNTYSDLGREARQMLQKWEAGDPDTIALWRQMNNWVYEGFDETYKRLGVAFDKLYYESDTWELGKEMVARGLEEGIFYREKDGSVWVNLEDEGLDKKILLRSDGTSVYITQDLGTAHLRYEDFRADGMIYVVADEQDYHFKVLFATLRKLGEPYAGELYHLSYGMVDLTSGKMKSREGTVVDADDLMDTVYAEAEKAAAERGEIAGLSKEEQTDILRRISLAALKFYILRVDPRKRMLFNPEESLDLQGQTGPYIQNAYVRIRSILARQEEMSTTDADYRLHSDERRLLSELMEFPEAVRDAARDYNPSVIAQYCYSLAKTFHRYYHDHRVLNAETEAAKVFRLRLIRRVADVLKNGMDLLGIEMPEKM